MKIKLFIPIVIILLLTSCTQVIVDRADEIRMNKWTAQQENGNMISLSFRDDVAEFNVKNNNKKILNLKGLCVIDDKRMLIYNQSEEEPYFFDYKINNNKLILKYDKGKIELTR